MRGQIAGAMGIKPEELRVLTDDLGGGFGMKGWCYPEYIPMLHAARLLEKPIHWVSTRAEAFVSDNQGRDSFWTAELALSARGRFLGLRVDCLGNVGAYITGVAHFVFTTHISGCLPTVYDIPQAQVNARCVLHQHAADRALSRRRPPGGELSDGAADRRRRRCDRHRRRRIAPAQSDRGRQNSLHHRLRQHLRQRRISGGLRARARRSPITPALPRASKAAKKAGKLRGIGIGCYLEIAGAFPEEAARISFPGGKAVNVSIGAGASGQGHQDGVRPCRRAPARHRAGGGDRHGGRLGARRAGLRRRRLALGHVCRRRHCASPPTR